MQITGICRAVALLGVVLTAVACGDTPIADNNQTSGVHLTGRAGWFLVPSYEVGKSFAGLQVSVLSYEALASTEALSRLKDDSSIGGASSNCAGSGCTFKLPQVPLDSATKGVWAYVSPSTTASQKVWQPVATMVVNPNQLLMSNRFHTAVAAENKALLLSKEAVAKLAALVDLDADSLVARGACLAFVASSRTYTGGDVPGVQAARVQFAAGQGDNALAVYPDDSYARLQTIGTNSAGAVLIVGPPVALRAGAQYAMGVQVAATGSGMQWPNAEVVVRPGMLTVMPLLPYP